jgi:ABC-2 type transport system ATP-binding protein
MLDKAGAAVTVGIPLAAARAGRQFDHDEFEKRNLEARVLEVQNLSRRFGDFTAVDDVSFEVGDGEIVGMLGPNGAGKTTTIRMITGFLPASAGRVTLEGRDLLAEGATARRHLGYLPENVALYPEMRVGEYLAYRARLVGLGKDAGRTAIGEAVERCLLAEVRGQIIGTLSKGYRQRVGLAAAILHRPKVLVLDEPTVGLDPRQIIAIRELIRDLGSERTLLLSTHILPEVELLCRRVLIVDRGRIVGHGTPESLRQRWLGNPQVRVLFSGRPADAVERLGALPGAVAARPTAGGDGNLEVVVEAQAGADLREAVFRCAVEHDWAVLELGQDKASLEDIFVRLTTRDADLEARQEAIA